MTLGIRKTYFTFWGLFLGLSTPIIFYVSDIFSLTIPTISFWNIIYLFGVLPAILSDIVYTFFSPAVIPITYFLHTLLIFTQLIFAYIVSISTQNYGSDITDIGSFRERLTIPYTSYIVIAFRLYIMSFILFIFFSIVI